jgi:hypothetical protein
MQEHQASTFPDLSVKPFRMRRLPAFPLSGEQIAQDVENVAQNHVDVIGCVLFQARDDTLDTFKALAQNEQYRSKLGRQPSAPFSALAELSPEAQQVALSIAELGMNRMIEACAAHFAAGERALPGDYCLEYKIDSQLTKIVGANANGVKLKAVSRAAVTDALLETFGRWLRMFGKRRR